ncbi:hypothetical protein [Plebeiibacterium sediminum]|uniref:Uncharacterized protein n=1 Tax=Plebeiibacterium sediminum TaxID=2992112 RepID=A0AAE3M919_9BACT|nr:hypothetical protein [Plebeiobacterium sediminum]MCW3789476.1 hypothetical protein [Plebeiobacterium sediminum]
MESKKPFDTQISDETYQFIKAMEKPNTKREFEKLMNAVADKSDIEKFKFVIRAINEFEKVENNPHTYPWYYTEMLDLLRKEKGYFEAILNAEKNYKEIGLIGISTTFTDAQIETIYNNATKEGLIKTSKTNFFDMLRGKECKEITWLEYRGKNPNKTALRYFTIFIFQSPKEIKPLARKYFKDKKGNSIETTSGQADDKNTIWEYKFSPWIK